MSSISKAEASRIDIVLLMSLSQLNATSRERALVGFPHW